jgi:hypothetical protein
MTKEEFVKAMTYLGIAYNKEFDEKQLSVWYDFFKKENYQDFKNAIKRIASKNQYLPSIAELKQELVYIKTPLLQLKADEEWDKVKNAIRKYAFYRADEAMKSFNPLTANVVRALGGFEQICQNTDGDWLRKNFIEIFNTKMENTEEIEMLNEPQLTLSELLKLKDMHDKEIGMISLNKMED